MRTFRKLDDWLSQIYRLDPTKMALGLDRLKHFLRDHPWDRFSQPIVSVTGTNGKGSTVAFLANMLTSAGYQVATFTSPHVLRFNERIQINGKSVSDRLLCEAFEKVEQARNGIELTFFEYGLLSALNIFQDQAPDILIFEVGLGGEKDAVNVLDADVSVITTVDIDHVQWLGDTRELIGAQKAGLMRAGKPVVCGDPNPPESITQIAQRLAAPLYINGQDYHFQQLNGHWCYRDPTVVWSDLPLPQLPMVNAATALKVLSLLTDRFPIPKAVIDESIGCTRLLGRMQPLPSRPGSYLDVAHNVQSVSLLANRLKTLACSGKTVALFSLLNDKDLANVLVPMLDQIDSWFITVVDSPRAAKLVDLEHALRQLGVKNIHCFHDVPSAYLQAINALGSEDRLIVFGSFYLVAEVLWETEKLSEKEIDLI